MAILHQLFFDYHVITDKSFNGHCLINNKILGQKI